MPVQSNMPALCNFVCNSCLNTIKATIPTRTPQGKFICDSCACMPETQLPINITHILVVAKDLAETTTKKTKNSNILHKKAQNLLNLLKNV